MASNNFEKDIKEFDSVVLSNKEGFASSEEILFTAQASRLVMALHITAITGTLDISIENSIDTDENFIEIFSASYTGVEDVSITLPNIHKFFKVNISVTGGSADYMFGGTGSETDGFPASVGGSAVISNGLPGSAGIVPFDYDEIEITAVNGNGDPTEVEYHSQGSTVATLTIVYDINDNVQKVTRS